MHYRNISRGELHTAPYIARAHRLLQRRFPDALWIGAPPDVRLALTFDDGPDPRATERLLETLARHDVPATFFNIGERAAAHPSLVRAVHDAGHGLGIHGYRHRPFPLIGTASLEAELRLAQAVLADATGAPPATFQQVRPPFGWFTPALLRQLTAWDFRPVMWTVVPPHWLQTAQRTYADVQRETCACAILVLHESLPGPPIADLTDGVLTRLKDRGFAFTTIDAMWQAVMTADAATSATNVPQG